MSKIKAIEICKNLQMSIKNAAKRMAFKYKKGVGTNPSAQKSALKRKQDYIMKQYNLTENDLI
jgi:hypothetical protein